MSDDVLESAGQWYMDVLVAVTAALVDLGLPDTAATARAPSFVASLARRGWSIERSEIA